MHAYIITRGIKHDIDRFIIELQGKYLPYEARDKNGERADCMVQLGVRPIQLWEIVFPESQLQTIMKTLFEDTTRGEFSYSRSHDKYLWALRKAFQASKFPDLSQKALPLPIYKKNISVTGIGLKKDFYRDGIEML